MTDREHARAIAERAAKLHRSIDPGWCHWPTTCNACELIAAALTRTADTARAQAFEEATKIVEAIQTERGDAIATRKCEDAEEGECHYYAGEFNGLNEVLSKLRARATSGDTP